ncbi:hypothetical protein TNCV_3231591 [Trichonephila clavipes]|nr:hypothetical protein TNCV_3231591 [Trichonephila clavipes]
MKIHRREYTEMPKELYLYDP